MRASRLLALARLLLLLGQAAAFEASNVLVVLEGRTPGGEHDHLLGAYALRSESVYVRVRTETKPTADAAGQTMLMSKGNYFPLRVEAPSYDPKTCVNTHRCEK